MIDAIGYEGKTALRLTCPYCNQGYVRMYDFWVHLGTRHPTECDNRQLEADGVHPGMAAMAYDRRRWVLEDPNADPLVLMADLHSHATEAAIDA